MTELGRLRLAITASPCPASGGALRRPLTAIVAVAMLVGATRDLSAHRRDELLQAARIAIEDNRVEIELSLTPGIDVADAVIAAIDRDRDGAVSAVEQRDYLRDLMLAMSLSVDGKPLTLEGTATFPALPDLRAGDRSIEVRSIVALPVMTAGRHQLAFGNRHRQDISVYLANALRPDGDSIAVIAQTRDPGQRTLTIDYSVGGEHLANLPVWLFGSGAAAWLAFRARRIPVRGH